MRQLEHDVQEWKGKRRQSRGGGRRRCRCRSRGRRMVSRSFLSAPSKMVQCCTLIITMACCYLESWRYCVVSQTTSATATTVANSRRPTRKPITLPPLFRRHNTQVPAIITPTIVVDPTMAPTRIIIPTPNPTQFSKIASIDSPNKATFSTTSRFTQASEVPAPTIPPPSPSPVIVPTTTTNATDAPSISPPTSSPTPKIYTVQSEVTMILEEMVDPLKPKEIVQWQRITSNFVQEWWNDEDLAFVKSVTTTFVCQYRVGSNVEECPVNNPRSLQEVIINNTSANTNANNADVNATTNATNVNATTSNNSTNATIPTESPSNSPTISPDTVVYPLVIVYNQTIEYGAASQQPIVDPIEEKLFTLPFTLSQRNYTKLLEEATNNERTLQVTVAFPTPAPTPAPYIKKKTPRNSQETIIIISVVVVVTVFLMVACGYVLYLTNKERFEQGLEPMPPAEGNPHQYSNGGGDGLPYQYNHAGLAPPAYAIGDMSHQSQGTFYSSSTNGPPRISGHDMPPYHHDSNHLHPIRNNNVDSSSVASSSINLGANNNQRSAGSAISSVNNVHQRSKGGSSNEPPKNVGVSIEDPQNLVAGEQQLQSQKNQSQKLPPPQLLQPPQDQQTMPLSPSEQLANEELSDDNDESTFPSLEGFQLEIQDLE